MAVDSSLSLFALITDHLADRIAPIQATKATLVDVSHALEDLVISERLPALIFTGFQESSHWRAETTRYRDLAGVAHQICIFAGGSLPPESDQRQIHVTLRGPDPLRQEWFLLALTERFAAVLCGRDRHAPVLGEGDRLFDTFWSFEPDLIVAVLDLLRDVVARERPDRLGDLEAAIRRFPPPAPEARLLTLFTSRLIDSLTAQHQSRLQLERMMAYESRLRALGQILSGVAHELNNPLQGILGFASMIAEDDSLSVTTTEDANHIIEAAQRAQGIVQALLQLARPAPEHRITLELGPLVERTLVFVRSDLNSHGIELSFAASREAAPVLGNPVRLQQLLINLLTNAIQALAGVGGPRRIDLRVTAPSPEVVELLVRDTGPGIPQQLQESVFEPFFTTKPVGEGTGLGLSIVRTIVDEHGAKLALESGSAGGAAFRISFPAAAAAAGDQTPAAAPHGRGRVLVVDDDPQVNALITRALGRAGYSTRSERSAEVALERVAQEPFDALICDMLMPGLGGVEFYERLVVRCPELARRLIFVTGDATRPTTIAFLEGSGRPYVIKPFTPAQLLGVVAEVVAAR